MSCEWLDRTDLYVDEELDTAARNEVSAHLRACPECSSAVAAQMALKKATRTAGSKFSAPPELHAAIYRQMHPHTSAGSWWKWLAVGAGMAAAALAVLLVAKSPETNRPLMAGLVDQHITTLASTNPVDVASEDRHTVKPWFQGKLAFTFTPPELAGSAFKLIGGKVIYVQQRPGAELLYASGAHKISVFVFKASEAGDVAPSWQASHSFNASAWREGGLEFYLVTDASKDEASGLVSMFEKANRS